MNELGGTSTADIVCGDNISVFGSFSPHRSNMGVRVKPMGYPVDLPLFRSANENPIHRTRPPPYTMTSPPHPAISTPYNPAPYLLASPISFLTRDQLILYYEGLLAPLSLLRLPVY